MKFIRKLFIVLPIILLFWFFTALAADGYLEILKQRRGWYVVFRFVDYIHIYCLLSLIVLSMVFVVRNRRISYVFLCVIFLLFLWLNIEDDIAAGRPILPEILFTSIIFLFHACVLRGLDWLKAQSVITQ